MTYVWPVVLKSQALRGVSESVPPWRSFSNPTPAAHLDNYYLTAQALRHVFPEQAFIAATEQGSNSKLKEILLLATHISTEA